MSFRTNSSAIQRTVKRVSQSSLDSETKTGVILTLLARQHARRRPLSNLDIESSLSALAREARRGKSNMNEQQIVTANILGSLRVIDTSKRVTFNQDQARTVHSLAANVLEACNYNVSQPFFGWGIQAFLQGPLSSLNAGNLKNTTIQLLSSPEIDSQQARELIRALTSVHFEGVEEQDQMVGICSNLLSKFENDRYLVNQILQMMYSLKFHNEGILESKWRHAIRFIHSSSQARLIADDVLRENVPRPSFIKDEDFHLVSQKLLDEGVELTAVNRWLEAGYKLNETSVLTILKRLLAESSSREPISSFVDFHAAEMAGPMFRMLLEDGHRYRESRIAPLIEKLLYLVPVDDLVFALNRIPSLNWKENESRMMKRLNLEIGKRSDDLNVPTSALKTSLESLLKSGISTTTTTDGQQLEHQVSMVVKLLDVLKSRSSVQQSEALLPFLESAYLHPDATGPTLTLVANAVKTHEPIKPLNESWWEDLVVSSSSSAEHDSNSSHQHQQFVLPNHDLRKLEWAAICLDKFDSLPVESQPRTADAKNFYITARLVCQHPEATSPAVDALTRLTFKIFRACELVTRDNFEDLVKWFVSEGTLKWRGKGVHLHLTATSAMTLNNLRFNEVPVAKNYCELIKQTILDRSYLKNANLGPDTEQEVVRQALLVASNACIFLQTNVTRSEKPEAAAESLLEWFFAENRLGMFGALMRTAETCTDIAIYRLALRCVRDILVMDLVDRDAAQKPFFESVRKRLAQILVSGNDRFPVDKEGMVFLLSSIVPFTTYLANEPNVMWSESGTQMDYQAAQYLAWLARSNQRVEMHIGELERESSDDFEELEGDNPVKPMSIKAWATHLGFLSAPNFRSTAQTRNVKEWLTPVARDYVGNALLMLNYIPRDRPRTHSDTMHHALGSFAGRKGAQWSRIDTKIILHVLQKIKMDGHVPYLPILMEFSKRSALAKLPSNSKSVEGVKNQVCELLMEVISSSKSTRSANLLALKTVSNLLENWHNVSELQLQLREEKLDVHLAHLLSKSMKSRDYEVLEATCFALQNYFAFQPAVTRPLYEEFLNNKTSSVVYQLMTAMMNRDLMKIDARLATAVLGAYLSLISADSQNSVVCSISNPLKVNMLNYASIVKTLHPSDRTFNETALALMDFIKSQQLRTLGSITVK